MGRKRCTGCHEEEDEALFVMDRARQRRKARCLACTSAASKAWRKAIAYLGSPQIPEMIGRAIMKAEATNA